MKHKFFAIPARNPAAAEDDLNAFCTSHRVTFIDKHLVADGADSFWSVCVSWLDGEAAASVPANNRNKPTSFACRPGLGVHRAAERVQQCIRHYPWYCQIDISSYFASIDHGILLSVLLRRFKGDMFGRQLQRLLDSHQHQLGKGLPIGSLTSQYFANYYLDGLDRLLNGLPQVLAHVRYMDDVVWWGDDKQQVRQVLQQVQDYLREQRQLQIKSAWRLQRSAHGIGFCGYRILPGAMRLSVRRKRRYQQRRLYWERQYRLGTISATQLQTAYAAVHAILQGTDSDAWRRQNLRHHPPISI